MNPTMNLEQVRDSLRSQYEQVEKDENKFPECAYRVPAWLLDDLADAVDAHLAERAALLAQPSKAHGSEGAVAWMTHHDQPMLFLDRAEASSYCDDDEPPIQLFTQSATPAADPVVPDGWALVPRKVTPEIESVYANDSGAYQSAQELHDAMIAAAPKGVI